MPPRKKKTELEEMSTRDLVRDIRRSLKNKLRVASAGKPKKDKS